MTRSRRLCSLERLVDEARVALREVELEENARRLQQMLADARQDPVSSYRGKPWYPRYVVWELTLACNMRCGHCGSAAGEARPDELTLDELLRVCDELGALGTERVTLLGGEPLIHPHWPALARRMVQNGYRANVITNGYTLHRPEVCDQIAEAELSIVGISVDGLQVAHDRLRRREGSFARIVTGMDLLRQRGVPVAATTVITRDSLADLEGLHALLVEHGVLVWQLQIANPLGRLDRHDPLLVTADQLPELLDFVARKKAQGEEHLRIDVSDNIGYYGPHEANGIRQKRGGQAFFWTGCHAGIHALGIDSNGDVKGCQSLTSIPAYVEGNVRHRSLADIWNDPESFKYTRQFQLSDLRGACAACTYGPLCKAGCTSSALAHTGTIGENLMCVQLAKLP